MFNEDLSVFLADFGIDVTVNGETDLAIFDAPDQEYIGNMQQITEYQITYPIPQFSTLKKGMAVVANGMSFVAKDNPKRIGDGVWKTVGLSPL